MPKRALYAALAWVAATATAMAVVWAGLDSVLSTATAGPHVADIAAWPVQVAASAPVGTGSRTRGIPVASASATPRHSRAANGAGDGSGADAASSSPPSPAAPSATPSAPPPESDGVQSRYSTPGGTVVLTVGSVTATLDAATPAPGYVVQSWKGQGFVEVEFSPPDAGTAYEVLATWAGTSPQVQTVTVGS